MDKFQRGINIVSSLIALLFLIAYGRLGYLQLIDSRSLGSRSGSIRRIWVQPPRGHIIDRNGKIIVENRALYTVKIITSEFNDSKTGLLAWLLQISPEELKEKISEGKAYNVFSAVTVYRDLDVISMGRVSENLWQLPGVLIDVENKRKYSGDFFGPHMLGYLKGISAEQLESLSENGYNRDDKIGYTGLEKTYEERLKGQKGVRFELVDPLGEYAGTYEDGRHDILSVKGDDLYLTIDAELQQLAEKLLRGTGRSGAVVAIDPTDGGILAMTSQPDFDPEILNGSTDKKEWANIALSPQKPLFNRAIQAAYPPGSTYKLLLAIAALEENIITPQQTINCSGVFSFGSGRFHCHGGQAHGSVNMKKAIIESCNVYFFNLIMKVGLDKWSEYGTMFGFGRKTGVDITGERSGLLPSSHYYDKRFGAGKWSKGTIISLGIGQGELTTTPLQLASFAATIANDGTLYQPHLVKGYRDTQSGTYVPLNYASKKLPISQQTFSIIKEGMRGVVLQGTGTLAKVPGIEVAGKTGTAQNPHGQDHAWFIAFAPLDHPKIAMAVLVENAGFGGSVSAPIARELIKYYVNGKKPAGESNTTAKAVASVKAFNDSLNADSKKAAKGSADSSSSKKVLPRYKDPFPYNDDL